MYRFGSVSSGLVALPATATHAKTLAGEILGSLQQTDFRQLSAK